MSGMAWLAGLVRNRLDLYFRYYQVSHYSQIKTYSKDFERLMVEERIIEMMVEVVKVRFDCFVQGKVSHYRVQIKNFSKESERVMVQKRIKELVVEVLGVVEEYFVSYFFYLNLIFWGAVEEHLVNT